MSNIALFSGSNVPAFAKKGELSDLAKSLAGGVGGGGGKRVSIKGGVFRLLVGGKEVAAIDERYLDVVVVNAAPKIGRTFYAKAYDGETLSGPDCWSADGETPSPESANKQSDRCATCPQNVKGSGMGESRACRFSQRLAVVLANDIDGDVMQLQLPATSIFGKEEGDKRPLQAFARYLAVQSPPINPEQIVTRMRFDTKAEAPKLFFQPMRWLTDDEYAVVQRQGTTADAQRAVVMTVAAADGITKAAPVALPGKPPAVEEDEAPAKPKAKKAKAEVVEDDGSEPEVRKDSAKPSAVPEKKSKLADIVSDWDDE